MSIIIAFSLISVLSSQHTVIGIVSDRVSGESLTGANILETETGRGTVSGIDGKFSLNYKGNTATIRISYTGYEPAFFVVSGEQELQVELERDIHTFGDDIIIVGSRTLQRTVMNSPVPVDQFSDAVLASTGETDLSSRLAILSPSFYSSGLTYSDATDHMNPAALRGMNPDQTLILVNGKRHHPSAIVNVLSVVGRGSVINDLNTIPSAAIERVEILRDGASAQYGSDAIAGVVNIVLREDTGKAELKTRYGSYYAGDGRQQHFSANLGKGFRQGGFINLTTELGVRGATNRAGEYSGLIYRTEDQDGLSLQENMHLDNKILTDRGLQRKDLRLKLGSSEMNNASLYMNSRIPVSENAYFYSFGGLNYRTSLSAGDYRLPNDAARSNLNIYPNGFLPEIQAELLDKYVVAGFMADITDWQVDFSTSWGSNSFAFFVNNSLNASMGDDSPLQFESGSLHFRQSTTHLDFTHSIDHIPGIRVLNILIGSEFRYENYQIHAGETGSWINENRMSFPGAQGYPGYQPVDEVNSTRTNTAVYTDLGFTFGRSLAMDLAARFEQYSDFGENLSGKFAIIYRPAEWLGLRSSVSSGFRAPALQQSYYSYTGSYYFGGSLFEVITAPNNSRVAEAFGIPQLKEETSLNISAGLTLSPGENSRLSIDLYQIDVKDRLVLSSVFFRFNPAVNELLRNLPDVGGAQFFSNAADTRSRGIDFVFTQSIPLTQGRLAFSAAMNLNETKLVGGVQSNTIIEGSGLEEALLDRQAKALLEKSQPGSQLNLLLNYSRPVFGANISLIRFGEVSYRGITADEGRDQDYGAKWISSLRLHYSINANYKLYAGVNNIFDVYPDKNNEVLQDQGRFIYNTAVTQFGFNGGFWYAGLGLEF